MVYCGYDIAAGTRNELSGEEGLAHFCEHMSFKGTARRNAIQIINAIEGLGGELNAFTNKEDTVYYAAISKEHFSQAVNVLTDIVFHSQYPQHEIDKEVEVICDEIESYNDSPAELIYDEFENLLFEGHPLGHNILGKAEQLRTYTTADALRFVQRNYRPEKMVFFVYGDIDFKRLISSPKFLDVPSGKAERGEIKRGLNEIIDTSICSDPLPPNLGGTYTIEKSTHQAHVMTGCQAYAYTDPRRMTLYLLNNILGGPGMNARLNLSLRERHGLVYTVESSMTSYSDTGAWSVYFGCDHHDVQHCLRLVNRELDRFMQSPLSDRQLTAAKRQLKGQLTIACDNREQFALDVAKHFLHYGRELTADTLLQQIDAITSAQIQQVAQELFAPSRLKQLVL